ncbi:MAG: O-antigen ligase family protein [Fimbriiglobus sp.]
MTTRRRRRRSNHPSLNPSWFIKDTPRLIRTLGEGTAIAIACASPWLYACNEPAFELFLSLAALILVGLWSAHAASTQEFQFRPDVVSVGLAAVVIWSLLQLIPLPEAIVGIISPTRLDWHRDLIPATTETIPGGGGGEARATFLPLTLDPAATLTFLARCLGLLGIYAAVRNWLATRDSVRRFITPFVAVSTFMAFLSVLSFFSVNKGLMLWSFEVESESFFGPFVCRNHYADYIYFSLGLCFTLFFPATQETSQQTYSKKSWLTPQSMIVCGVVVLLAFSLLLSLSRGGVIAAILAAIGTMFLTRLRRSDLQEQVPILRIILVVILCVAIMVGLWMGSDVIVNRAATLKTDTAVESRGPLWSNAIKLVPMTWTTGSGGGTFVHVETITRDPSRDMGIFYLDSAHNEYLEAIIEGGVIRLLLTLILAIGPLVVMGRGFLERRQRSIAPTILALWFATAAVGIHAFVDFGIHIPAIAATVAILVAFGMAAAVDTNFVPTRTKALRIESGDAAVTDLSNAEKEVAEEPRDPVWRYKGPVAVVLGFVACVPMIGVVWETRQRAQAEQLLMIAEQTGVAGGTNRFEQRAQILEQRANLIPLNPKAQLEAGEARLEVAIYRNWTQSGAILGAPLAYLSPPRTTSSPIPDEYRAAMLWFQQARAINPVTPKAHTRLAYLAPLMPGSVAAEHYRRAKRLLPADADLWYASGREAFQRGDFTAAKKDWQQSLTSSTRHADAIITAFRPRLTTEQIIKDLLPNEPGILLASMNSIYPNRLTQAAERQKFLDTILQATENRSDLTPENHITQAETYDELNRSDDADGVYLRAIAQDPTHHELRRKYADFLLRNDRPREALIHLEWLRKHEPRNPSISDQIEAARHAARLLEEINTSRPD